MTEYKLGRAIVFTLAAALLVARSAQAAKVGLASPLPSEKVDAVTEPSMRLLQFSLAQRFTYRENQGGPNLSWMPSWDPEFLLSHNWILQGSVGGTVMTSNRGSFPVFRTQVGVSYRGLSSSFFPEALVGAETWALPEGGVGFASGLNFHHSLSFKTIPVLRGLSSAYWGFHWAAIPYHPAYQVNLGVRWGGQ
jgi:hypothetical protein